MKRSLAVLLFVLLPLGQAAGPYAQQTHPADGIVRLLLKVEQIMQAGTPEAYMDLLSAVAIRGQAEEASRVLVVPGITRAVIRERDRAPLEGTLPGDGFRLMLEVFTERGDRARIVTWRLDIRRVPTDTNEDEWRIAGQLMLMSFEGLNRLALNPSKQYRARTLVVRSDDLEIRLDDGYVFVAETPEGPTAAVLMPVAGGTVRFRPAPETEREQVRIYAGNDTIETGYEAVFLRFSPSDFRQRFAGGTLTEEPAGPALLRRAQTVFEEEVVKSYGLDLADLSRDIWSLAPQPGDLLAEIQTRRFQTLTYTKSSNDAEDISLFDRRRRRNISVYPSPAHAAAGARLFEDEAKAVYEVSHYLVDVSFDPARQWLDGRATVRLKVKADALNTLTLRLAETLTVRSVYSSDFGRLLSFRVRGQNNVIVNLSGYATRGTELALVITYSGRLEPATPDRETLGPQFPQDPTIYNESSTFPSEPSLLYSTRSYWYPQSAVTGYSTATLHLTVPDPYHVVASGELAPGSPVVVPGHEQQPSGRLYSFEARQPARYFACLITHLVRVDTRTVSLVEALTSLVGVGSSPLPDDPFPAGSFNNSVDLTVEANPRLASRGRSAAAAAAALVAFYTSLVGDCPYPDLTVALIENALPGGHSPAYLSILNQPMPMASSNWSSDPAAFQNYPEFFLAHEIAHQWWGQAVGWRSYHDQWISEGFAQYFAALYARESRGESLFNDLVRRMARWARDKGQAGPVSLGYRLGHIQGDSRIFRAIVYNKSAVVLHMLRRMTGDEAFFRGVRRLYFGSRFRRVGTGDVRAAFEKESGQALEAFFQGWIEGSGTPQVVVNWTRDTRATPPVAVLRVEQRGKTFEFPVTATVKYSDRTTEDVTVVVRERVELFRFPLKTGVKEITLNRDGLTPLDIVRR